MLVQERRHALEEMLQEDGSIVVSDIAKRWDVSEMTVRRDLKALADQGMIARVHGGAVAQGSLRFQTRRTHATKAKQMAVDKLQQFIPQSGSIFIDGSTTMLGLCQYFKNQGGSGLQIATNNIDIFQVLQQFPGLELQLIGGSLDREVDNFVGPLARRAIEAMAFDAAFLSAYALDHTIGLSDPSHEDAAIKQLISDRSTHAYVAVSSEKISRRSSGVWSVNPQSSTLATELAANDSSLENLQSLFREII
ncbi:MAG: DeoR/GlpR transcriptional regulator [Planctomycetes bacterium]|nr:DeoR/GlpR transcriptional regulator [Planctomycetota bacterium]